MKSSLEKKILLFRVLSTLRLLPSYFKDVKFRRMLDKDKCIHSEYTLILSSESEESKIRELRARLHEEMGRNNLDYSKIEIIESELAKHGVHAERLSASSKEKEKNERD